MGRWWKGVYSYGRVFFEASSQQHAHALMQRWGAGFALGMPNTVKRCSATDLDPKDLNSGAYTLDRGVWVEQ